MTVKVASASLRQLVAEIFKHASVPTEEADYLADSLVRADARGMHSHGVLRVSQYLPKIVAGGIRAGKKGTIVADQGAIVLVDGEGGIGQVLSLRGMTLAIEKAKAFGVGVALVRDSNHHGESGAYAMMAAREGMVGIVTSNGSPSAPAWGGVAPRVTGPWPLAIAAPTLDDPYVLDMSLGVVSKGKIQHHANTNQKIPLGWGFDRDGAVTDDPNRVLDGGWSSFIGDYKGWGILVMIEVLTGVLSGGRIANEITDLFTGPAQSPQGLAHIFIAINVAAVQPGSAFAKRMDGMTRLLKGSQLATGFNEVLVPGEREFRSERAAEREGIVLPRSVVAQLVAAAKRVGCPSGIVQAAFAEHVSD